jgi:hypothetical protein
VITPPSDQRAPLNTPNCETSYGEQAVVIAEGGVYPRLC